MIFDYSTLFKQFMYASKQIKYIVFKKTNNLPKMNMFNRITLHYQHLMNSQKVAKNAFVGVIQLSSTNSIDANFEKAKYYIE